MRNYCAFTLVTLSFRTHETVFHRITLLRERVNALAKSVVKRITRFDKNQFGKYFFPIFESFFCR